MRSRPLARDCGGWDSKHNEKFKTNNAKLTTEGGRMKKSLALIPFRQF
jgi:hypothetical protein